jgi:hypothetical protein
MKLPRQFFKPLALGAPAPLAELPLKLERMLHFVPPHVEKLRDKVPVRIRADESLPAATVREAQRDLQLRKERLRIH